MGLLRFLFFLVIFYFISRLVRSLFVKKQEGPLNQNEPYQKKEGDVTITYDPRHHKQGNKVSGEYVDYEEVKEDD